MAVQDKRAGLTWVTNGRLLVRFNGLLEFTNPPFNAKRSQFTLRDAAKVSADRPAVTVDGAPLREVLPRARQASLDDIRLFPKVKSKNWIARHPEDYYACLHVLGTGELALERVQARPEGTRMEEHRLWHRRQQTGRYLLSPVHLSELRLEDGMAFDLRLLRVAHYFIGIAELEFAAGQQGYNLQGADRLPLKIIGSMPGDAAWLMPVKWRYPSAEDEDGWFH